MSGHLLTPRESTFRLSSEGVSTTGLTYEDVSVHIRKQGEAAFAEKTLSESDWTDLGSGFYAVKWSEDDMDTLGDFRYLVMGSDFDDVTGCFDVEQAPIAVAADAQTCIVSGSIIDINGDPSRQETIIFRPQRIPALSGATLLNSNAIRTTTDAFGNFSVALVRGTKILVEIERLAIRYLIEVPDVSSTSLVSLLPEFP